MAARMNASGVMEQLNDLESDDIESGLESNDSDFEALDVQPVAILDGMYAK